VKHVVKGSYVYAPGGTVDEEDNENTLWDKHMQNIAHTASTLDALLRPALHDQVDLSYPAERNLMFRLKGVANEASLYRMPQWVAKTTMNMNIGKTQKYTKDNTAFGLGDAEGKTLQKNITDLIKDARVLVSSAAVTTEVPARVKSSIAFEAYSKHKDSADTGDMKGASNVKESLIANATTGMMRRPKAGISNAKRAAIEEFKDRPRRLWQSINKAKNSQDATSDSVTAEIGKQVDSWRTLEQGEVAWEILIEKDAPRLLEYSEYCLSLRDKFTNTLKEDWGHFGGFRGDIRRNKLDELNNAGEALFNELIHLENHQQSCIDEIEKCLYFLSQLPAWDPENDALVERRTRDLTIHLDQFTEVIGMQIGILRDVMNNIQNQIQSRRR